MSSPLHTTRDPIGNALVARHLPELVSLDALATKLRGIARVQIEAIVPCDGLQLPIYSFEFGPKDPTTPVLVLVGGVHGLERIGTMVIIEYLKSLAELMKWDRLLRYYLETCRILIVPLVNPAGTYKRKRSNLNGVDLMRNAPVEAEEALPYSLVGGHRLSPSLPWYRGAANTMELETSVMCRVANERIFPSAFALALDVHSGFGQRDRLWFPYAHSRKMFPDYLEIFSLKRKLDQTLTNHVYQIEPQSLTYLTHGDLWDHLYMQHFKERGERRFIPLTLEMGSWAWVRKNPLQMLSLQGIFNPLLPHRTRRILRRHLSLFDVMMRLTASHAGWRFVRPDQQRFYDETARSIWYPHLAAAGE